MTDLTKLSTEDLMALREGDLSKVSTEGLMHLKGQSQENMPEAPTAAVKAGRGMMDFYQGVKQKALNWTDPAAAKEYTDEVNKEQQQYSAARAAHGDTGFDWWRMGGNVATPTAAIGGGQTAMARMGYGALQGAMASYGNFSNKNDPTSNATSTLAGAGAGGVLNAAAPYVVSGVTKAAQGIKNAAGDLVDRFTSAPALSYSMTGKIPVQVELAIKQELTGNGMQGLNWSNLDDQVKKQLVDEGVSILSKTGNFTGDDVANLLRKTNLIGQGFTPTKGMVTRNPRDWTVERTLQKSEVNDAVMGDSITSVDQANQSAARNRLSQLANETGGQSGSSYATGKQAFATIKQIERDSQKAVSDLYGQIRQKVGDQGGIEYKSLLGELDGLKDNAYASGFHDSIVSRLSRLLGKEQTLTINKAEELRKFIGTLPDNVSGVDLGGFKSRIRDAIDNDVIASAGQDFFQGARAAARDRFQMLHNPAIQKVLKTAGDLGQDKTAMNWVKNQIIQGGPDDINHLRMVLEGPEYAQKGGKALWDNIRRRTMEWMGEEAKGQQGAISGSNFNKALDQLGEDRLQSLFSAEERTMIERFRKALESATVEPFGSAPNRSNTAPAFASLMRSLAVGKGTPWINSVWVRPLESAAEERTKGQLLATALKANPIDTTARDTAQAQLREKMARMLMGRTGMGAIPAAMYQGMQN
jgi:hypothetical protein